MTTPPRKTKLYRKVMWAAVKPGRTGHMYPTKALAMWHDYARLGYRVVRVLVTELPKAAGRGKK